MDKGDTVIVLDNKTYHKDFAEPTPFKARIIDFYESGILVISEETNKGYELKPDKILDFIPIEDMKEMLYVFLKKEC